MSLEITGIHGSAVNLDTPSARHIANRISKGIELLKSDETDYIAMLGYTGKHMKNYALKKYNVSKRKVLADNIGKDTLEETISYKHNIITPNGFSNIGSVSQCWHINRIGIIYEKVLPQCSVTYFVVEDGRSEREIKIDTDKEKIVTQIDKYRLKLPLSVATSKPLQKLLGLSRDLYFSIRSF